MFKPGDYVSVIHESIKGKVKEVKGRKVMILDDDGFTRAYIQNQLVPYKTEAQYKLSNAQIERVINEQLDRQNIQLVDKKGVGVVHNKQESFEIDLHIEELIDDYKFLNNSEIMMIQMRYCRIFIERAIRLKVSRALLIHGKGEGVLRTEIHKYLDRIESQKHIRLDYREVNNEGATQVFFM